MSPQRRHTNFQVFDTICDMNTLPIRKLLNHTPPFKAAPACFFVTICAAERGGNVLVEHAPSILEAARHRLEQGKWFLDLFLIMPDHLHLLVHIPPSLTLTDVISDFKRYLSTFHKVSFQHGYFDTRIRDNAHFTEKWNYIVKNPVAKGLVATPREWPYSIAFDRTTGEE